MNEIKLEKVIPEVFREETEMASDIWRQERSFVRGYSYLVEAISGAGKSSLCSFIYGHRSDYQGKIFFDDCDIRTRTPKQWEQIRNRHLGIVFQGLRLFPELTVWENIWLKNGLTGYRTESWIKARLEETGLTRKTHTLAAQLSFGQQQRAALVRALCQPADFILLDEPVSHLDEENIRICSELLDREVRRQGTGMIVTSIGKQLQLPYHKIYKL